MLLQMVQRLESELQTKQMEADKLQVEKASNQQRIKLLEHEISKTKKLENATASDKDTVFSKLQNEYEELKITNTVYLEKINELVDEINVTREEGDSKISELEVVIDSLQKQMKEHSIVPDLKFPAKSTIDSNTGKSSVSKSISGGNEDGVAMRKEIDALRQKIVILTDKNMEYQNVLSDFKNRDRSRSKNSKK